LLSCEESVAEVFAKRLLEPARRHLATWTG
jgi:hypothetical protein